MVLLLFVCLFVFLSFDRLTSIALLQRRGFVTARHNNTGEEGLVASANLREREALRVDPSLSLMPYVSSSSRFDALDRWDP